MTKATFSPFSATELPQDRALRLGAERLRQAVGELPLRYAPFFGRLAELWEAPEEVVRSELSRAKDPKAWSFGLLPGLRTFDVDVGARRAEARARLLRFDPGAHFPRHRHRGTERVLVLEGAYTDGSPHPAHAGDERTLNEGSEHELTILPEGPCVAAVSERGIEFTSPWLRWANLLLR